MGLPSPAAADLSRALAAGDPVARNRVRAALVEHASVPAAAAALGVADRHLRKLLARYPELTRDAGGTEIPVRKPGFAQCPTKRKPGD
jgi:hypothetical protein